MRGNDGSTLCPNRGINSKRKGSRVNRVPELNLEIREGITNDWLKENCDSNFDSFKFHSVLCASCISLGCYPALFFFRSLVCMLKQWTNVTVPERGLVSTQSLKFCFLWGIVIFYIYKCASKISSALLRGGVSMDLVLPVYCSNVKIHYFQWCSLPLWWVKPTPAYSRKLKCLSFPFWLIPRIYPSHHNSSLWHSKNKVKTVLSKCGECLSLGISASAS